MRRTKFPLILCLLGLAAFAGAQDGSLPKGSGLAAKYPGDRGIEKDAQVIFAEDFEEPSLDAVKKRWETVDHPEIMSLSEDTPSGSAGKHSLLMTHVGGKGSGGYLYRRLLPGYNRLYVRFYVKFDPQCAPNHHFLHVGGYNPATPYPQGGAGLRPHGDERFSTGVEPFGDNWVWDYYAYWMEMQGSPPRGQTWGNSFIHNPALKVNRGKWQCMELIMKTNDVGDKNGEIALWIDGKQVSHLGKGFPNGKWVFDKFLPGAGGEGVRWNDTQQKGVPLPFPPEGLPFEGFRWRSDEKLRINFLWVLNYITAAPQGHISKVWFDNIVVSKAYIGPIQK